MTDSLDPVVRKLAALFRLLPPGFPGKARLARRLLTWRLPGGFQWIPMPHGAALKVPSLREPVAFHLLVDGTYEPLISTFLNRHLQSGMVFVDVGANIGVHTLSAARCVGAGGRVMAFEPSPQVFPCLVENVAASGCKNVTSLPLALCEQPEGSVAFYPAPADHFGMGGLAPQFGSAPVQVPASTLDRCLAAHNVTCVHLIKVDVEGFEASVFRGASQLLRRPDAPPVIFEFSDWAEARACEGRVGVAQDVLREYGYRIWALSAWLREGSRAPESTDASAPDLIAFKRMPDG